MGIAEVQPETCAACHDPHDATNPAQLRVYDAVAALPNGLTNVSGMGAGMICVTCHNSRDGEHTDTATMAPNASGVMVPTTLASFMSPHAASQADAMFGFNAYFVNRLSPSPHLAVADTCAGCHFVAPTAAETAAKQTSNHSFVVDKTICASCHSDNVDGQGLEAANKAELDQLRNLWASTLISPLAAALAAAPGATILARAYDPTTGLYSSKSASTSNVTIGAVPIAAAYASLTTSAYGPAASAGVTLTLATPVTVQWVDTNGNPVGVPVTTSTLTVSPATLTVSSGATTIFQAPSANASDVLVLYKGYWNIVLLNNDNTFGIHNPGFYDAVLDATTAQLAALP
jgi:predicted CXXCH cytochrome family protein